MYEYGSRVRLTEVDQNRRMTLMGILNAFQDCSTFHSEDLGVGMEYLEREKRMWVLRSWELRIFRRPALAEHIRIGTWPYAFEKITGQRNFRLIDGAGALAACADTTWVYMDTKRMRPARIGEEITQIYGLEPKLSMGSNLGQVCLPEASVQKEPFAVRIWHLDVNHHVNNGQYIQFAESYLPEDFEVRTMRAEYKKSAVLNDRIFPRVGSSEDRYTVSLEDESGKTYAAVEFRQE